MGFHLMLRCFTVGGHTRESTTAPRPTPSGPSDPHVTGARRVSGVNERGRRLGPFSSSCKLTAGHGRVRGSVETTGHRPGYGLPMPSPREGELGPDPGLLSLAPPSRPPPQRPRWGRLRDTGSLAPTSSGAQARVPRAGLSVATVRPAASPAWSNAGLDRELSERLLRATPGQHAAQARPDGQRGEALPCQHRGLGRGPNTAAVLLPPAEPWWARMRIPRGRGRVASSVCACLHARTSAVHTVHAQNVTHTRDRASRRSCGGQRD